MVEQDGSGRDEGAQDGIYVSGFVVKLYQMVNEAPDEIVSVSLKYLSVELDIL